MTEIFMPLGLKSFPGVAEQGFRGGSGSGSDPNNSFFGVLSIIFLTNWVLRRKGAGHNGLSLYIYIYIYISDDKCITRQGRGNDIEMAGE